MPIDVALLATTVVGQVLLPFIKAGAEKLKDLATEKFNQAAAEGAVNIAEKTWTRVKETFSQPADKAILENFEKYPDQAKPLVEAVLIDKLKQDPQLAEELDAVVNQPVSENQNSGAQIIGATYALIQDFRQANISGDNFQNIGMAFGEPRSGASNPSGPMKPSEEGSGGSGSKD